MASPRSTTTTTSIHQTLFAQENPSNRLSRGREVLKRYNSQVDPSIRKAIEVKGMSILASPLARGTAAITGIVVGGVSLALYNETRRIQSSFDRSWARTKAINEDLARLHEEEEANQRKRKSQKQQAAVI